MPTTSTDVIRELKCDESRNDIVITSAGGTLTLAPNGFRLDGPPQAMEHFGFEVMQHGVRPSDRLELRINSNDGTLEIVKHRPHSLGALSKEMRDSSEFRAKIELANRRLKSWR